MLYEAGLKIADGVLYTSGAMIIFLPSLLLLLHFSEQRRIKTLQNGLKEFPKLFTNAFSPIMSNQTKEKPALHSGGLRNMFSLPPQLNNKFN